MWRYKKQHSDKLHKKMGWMPAGGRDLRMEGRVLFLGLKDWKR